jgi:uncharacterized membrane protein
MNYNNQVHIYHENQNQCIIPKRKTMKYLFFQSLYEFIIFTIIFYFLAFLFTNQQVSTHINLYLLNIIALINSIYVSYLKIRSSYDPNFLPACSACVGKNSSVIENTFSDVYRVVEHKKGSLFFNIPNSVFGIGYYLMMLYLWNDYFITGIFSIFFQILLLTSLILSIYLWKTMIYEIKRICIICMSIHAVNFINFSYMVFRTFS